MAAICDCALGRRSARDPGAHQIRVTEPRNEPLARRSQHGGHWHERAAAHGMEGEVAGHARAKAKTRCIGGGANATAAHGTHTGAVSCLDPAPGVHTRVARSFSLPSTHLRGSLSLPIRRRIPERTDRGNAHYGTAARGQAFTLREGRRPRHGG